MGNVVVENQAVKAPGKDRASAQPYRPSRHRGIDTQSNRHQGEPVIEKALRSWHRPKIWLGLRCNRSGS